MDLRLRQARQSPSVGFSWLQMVGTELGGVDVEGVGSWILHRKEKRVYGRRLPLSPKLHLSALCNSIPPTPASCKQKSTGQCLQGKEEQLLRLLPIQELVCSSRRVERDTRKIGFAKSPHISFGKS